MEQQTAMGKERGISSTEFLLKYGLYIGFAAIIVVFAVISPSFLTVGNIVNILDQFAYYMIASIGMMFVILTGNVDLSISGMVAFAGVAGATVMANTKSILLGCVVILGVTVLGGLFTGTAVARIGMPAFIATLAFQYFLRGSAYTMTSAKTVTGLPRVFTAFNFVKILGIKSSIFILIIVFLLSLYLLNFSKFGKRLYAVGDNPQAAQVMGINVKRVTVLSFVICGICTGIATIILISYMASARAAVVENLQLECIAAVVIGGASATGGEGKITGTVIGALLFAMVKNGLNLMGFSYYYQLIASGVIIYIAATIDRMRIRAGI